MAYLFRLENSFPDKHMHAQAKLYIYIYISGKKHCDRSQLVCFLVVLGFTLNQFFVVHLYPVAKIIAWKSSCSPLTNVTLLPSMFDIPEVTCKMDKSDDSN